MESIPLTDREDVREIVRQKYGEAAMIVLEGRGEACCGSGNIGTGKTGTSCCGTAAEGSDKDAITSNLYSDTEAAEIPEAALLASLGCGNPTALASLSPGEIVLDLGSGGGIDVLLSARRVGPTGFAYGLDMTDEMLALAEQNKAKAGATNVQFLKGHIEEIPLPDESVDVIISNCVINLSADKDAVLREAFRVLKPGGRFAVSDVVVEGDLPDAVRRDMEAYVGCVAGALERSDYLRRLAAAGFVDGTITPTRRYTFADLEGTSCCARNIAALSEQEKADLDGRVMGAFIRANKPAAASCCGPDCCRSEAADVSAADNTSPYVPGVAEAAPKPADAACCGPDCCQPDPSSSTITLLPRIGSPAIPAEQGHTHGRNGTLKLSEFKTLLESHREKPFRLVLPNRDAVPVSFHITEVAHVQKRFIDCGGRLHTTHTCQLQVWLGPDTDHRLMAGKMADVLNIAKKVLPEDQDLDIEFEYEDATISQYPVTGREVTEDAVVLHLSNKHTDCLAKDVCLPQKSETANGDAGCCGPSGNC